MKRLLLATTLVVGAAGLASQADASRFLLTNGSRLYSGSLGSNSAISAAITGAPGNSPAIAFDSKGRLFGAFVSAGSTQIRQISGWEDEGSFAPMVGAVIGTTASQTNSFDFRDTGSAERLIGTRNAASSGGPQYFESDDSSYSSFSDAASQTGFGGMTSYPSTGYDRVNSVYWAITAGPSDSARSILTIDTGTGLAADTGLNLTFDGVGDEGDAGYGEIILAGGDFVEGAGFYLSFFSHGLGMAVIGRVDLTTGDFTQLTAFSLDGGLVGTMGLAIIPTPLAGGMSVAGLMLVGARRRRDNV